MEEKKPEQTEEQKKAMLAKRKQRRLDKEDVFEAFYGAAYGAIMGLMDSLISTQIIGAPHELKDCRAGKYCPLHGEKALQSEEGKADV